MVRAWWSVALPVAVLILGMGLAACGAGSANASSNRSIPGCSPSGCTNATASAAAEVMAVKFSGCMRTHGASNFPDPTIGSNGLPSWAGTDSASPAYQTAQRACRKDLPQLAPQTSAEKATANAEALRYSTCMRSNGVPGFPDPNGQGLIKINGTSGSLDPSAPQFQKAQAACKSLDNGFAQQSSGTSVSGGASSGS